MTAREGQDWGWGLDLIRTIAYLGSTLLGKTYLFGVAWWLVEELPQARRTWHGVRAALSLDRHVHMHAAACSGDDGDRWAPSQPTESGR